MLHEIWEKHVHKSAAADAAVGISAMGEYFHLLQAVLSFFSAILSAMAPGRQGVGRCL